MFDLFKLVAGSKGNRTTTIKAFGAKMKCEGMPTNYTIEGLEQLLLTQATIPTVSLPRQDANANVSAQSKFDAESIDTVIAIVRGEDNTTKQPKAPKGTKGIKDEAPKEDAKAS